MQYISVYSISIMETLAGLRDALIPHSLYNCTTFSNYNTYCKFPDSSTI